MKKISLFILLLCSTFVFAQIVNIPDAYFKGRLLEASPNNYIAKDLNGNYFKIDANGNGKIEVSEAENVSYLYLQGSSIGIDIITSLSGIEVFINLKVLDCSYNQLDSLNIQGLTNLQKLECRGNGLASIDVSKNINLNYLDCSYNRFSLLDISENFNLNYLDCSNNKLESLDVTKNHLLTSLFCKKNLLKKLDFFPNKNVIRDLDCSYNQFTSLNFKGITNLENLTCSSNNLITFLDLQNLKNLKKLICPSNTLMSSLNVKGCENLESIRCSKTSLLSLDVSGLKKLHYLYLWDNDLTHLNIKGTNITRNSTGGSGETSGILIAECYNLSYICCDEKQLNFISKYSGNATINTYCSFEPAGEKNTITGKLTFDVTNNGCDANDVLAKNLKVKLNDGTTTSYSLTNDAANYTFYTQTGNFTLTPIFENPYYTVSPATVTFTDVNNNIETKDFCITPIANKNDIETKIIPFDRARPGFNSKYELIYKNKGTTTLSGNVSFSFNDNYSDFVSSSVTPAMNSNGNLSYNFTDLKPFEERKITIELKHNTPTAPTFPLEGGEILNISSIINPITNDETANDNTFNLAQEVVNSFDPNDKTCLQGISITPDMIGNYVDYQIRFENNGSAEATFIVVKDVIDTNLFDIETLTPTSSSHPYHLTIKNGNVVEFYFEDINLPFAPANANDPKAQGFVSFKIKTKSTLQLGDILKNKADIYFDYNKPILTNEEQTKIENLSTENSILNTQHSILFTNPTKDKITFSEEVKSVQVFDLNGKLVQSSIINGTEMNVSSLQKGTYILKISTENGMKTSKLVKL